MSRSCPSPLHAAHLSRGARLIDFAGWEMPLQFAGILQEHRAVRERWGIFDISHMGILRVSGACAGRELNALLTNDLGKLAAGQGQYTLLLNEGGGVIDDLIVYRVEEDAYILVVNAARRDQDRAWLEEHLGEAMLEDVGAGFGAAAVQGPSAVRETSGLVPIAVPPRNGIAALPGGGFVCRTGYTGEDGFELFVPADGIADWWNGFLALGAEPCGLGARDTLRLEACYPLNGSDLSPDRTPLQGGLGFFVDLEKGPFPGREALLAQRREGLSERLAAFVMTAKGPPPRPHYELFAGADRVGESTSGCLSPTLEVGIGLAYVRADFAKPGTDLEIDIRGRRFPVQIRPKPLYRRP